MRTKKEHLKPHSWIGLPIILAISIGYFSIIFPFNSFVSGAGSYWQTQIQDVTQYISGLTAFRQEPWGIPLLFITSLNWPSGTFVTFADSIPLFAIFVKALHPIMPSNPFGLWVLFCYVSMGAAAWWAFKQAGGTKWISYLFVVGMCIQMPILTARLGHLSLMAQFLIVFALGIYFKERKTGKIEWPHWTALLVVSFYINFYITAMAGAIMLASLIDTSINNGIKQNWRYIAPILSILMTFPLMYGFGFGSSVTEGGYNFFSMNILSPFVGGSIVTIPNYAPGTIGQYEGFNYLGLGLIFGIITMLFFVNDLQIKALIQNGLMIVSICLIIYSLSNDIYLGPWKIIHWNVPYFLEPLTNTFRASGRLFWPVAYILVVCLGVWLDRFPYKIATLGIVLILTIQWFDLAQVRNNAYLSARRPPQIVAAFDNWSHSLRNVQTIYFYPKFRCGKADHAEILPIQSIAMNLGINFSTGYLARYTPDCGTLENEINNSDRSKSAYIFSKSDFTLDSALKAAPEGAACHPEEQWYYCR